MDIKNEVRFLVLAVFIKKCKAMKFIGQKRYRGLIIEKFREVYCMIKMGLIKI